MTDRLLAPVRRAIAEHVPRGSRVLELGFGTGDLLFRLLAEGRLREGVGLELDPRMIEHARSRAAAEGAATLRFEHLDATAGLDGLGDFDVATATLVVHELPEARRVPVLRRMAERARLVVVADYETRRPGWKRLLVHLDEAMAGHRHRFVTYERGGGMRPLLEGAGLRVEVESEVIAGGLRVWRCGRAEPPGHPSASPDP